MYLVENQYSVHSRRCARVTSTLQHSAAIVVAFEFIANTYIDTDTAADERHAPLVMQHERHSHQQAHQMCIKKLRDSLHSNAFSSIRSSALNRTSAPKRFLCDGIELPLECSARIAFGKCVRVVFETIWMHKHFYKYILYMCTDESF